jgi:uncharacterized protein
VDGNPSAVSFIVRFDTETVLVGYPKAHLWVEARDADDMDLFVLVQKLDAHGTPLAAFTVPNHGAMAHDVTDYGASILRYKGSDGRLRVSARRLDPALSTEDVPAHTFDRVEKLSPGQIVDVEIDLLPIGLRFAAGEQLRFVVSSSNLLGPMMPGIAPYRGANSGRHVIHTGGSTPSYLQLPVRTPARAERWVRLEGSGTDSTIDGFELFSARRALALLKGKLGRERTLALLADEIEAGNAFLREAVAQSEGASLTGTTVLRANGITAAAFGGWLARAFGREDVLLAGHPEHYSIHQAPGRDVNIVETLGDYVCSFYMRPWAGASTSNVRSSHIVLADGTVVGSVSTAFADTADGLVAELSVTLPSTCSALVSQHLEHFAVEFRTWILRAGAELDA